MYIYIYIYILYIYIIYYLFHQFLLSFLHSDTLNSDTLSLSPMIIQFPCGKCSKAVVNDYQAIKCDKCNLWIHIKYN